MPSPAQIGAASAAVGGGALGGYFLANGLSSTAKKTEVKNDPSLPKDETFVSSTFDSNSPYHQKFLTLTHQDHLKFLVKPTWDKGEEWWKWSFENKFNKLKNSNSLDTIFQKVDSAYSSTSLTTNPQTSLNQACDIAYKEDKTKYLFDNSHLLKNISDFCTNSKDSVDVSEPKFTLYASNDPVTEEYEVGVLSKSDNKIKLVKPIIENNLDLWWNWSFNKRLKDKTKDFSDAFNKVTKGYDSVTSTVTLIKACDEAYKKNETLLKKDSSKLLTEIQKLCASDTEQRLILPDPDNAPTSPVDVASETNYATTYGNGVGKVEANKNNLIKPVDNANKKWWWWAYRNRYLQRENSVTLHSDFENITKGYHESEASSLNKKCEEAYKKGKTELEKESSKLLNNIKEFCTKNKENVETTGLS